MTPFQATLLALVQAVTEFLPVSSSGHLILLPRLLGWADQGLEFDIATNSGTLAAIVVYFRRDLVRLVSGMFDSIRRRDACVPEAGLAWTLLLATVPAAIAGLLIKDWIANVVRGWEVVAANAAIYGVLLLVADRWGKRTRSLAEIGRREGILIGCAQALALVPGTSRSGITMTAALAMGYTREAAARFSFLLAVPVGLLVGAKQVVDVALGEPLGVPLGALLIGIAVSAVAGYAVIALLLAWVRSRSLAAFAFYRLGLAAFLWLYLG